MHTGRATEDEEDDGEEEEDDEGEKKKNGNVVYKDAVIVGNGPSGICLSYMFAGNWPYYTGEPHPVDEMLTVRLQYAEDHALNNSEIQENGWTSVSLAGSSREKLKFLASGIEGRSGGRPLALLMDQLQHPCVDAGMDVPSLLAWRSADHHPEHRVIDHVVLGKGQPGGAWQSMDPNVLTISVSRWMSLPDLDIRHWQMLVEAEQLESARASDDQGYLSRDKTSTCKTASRVSVGTVAAYYYDYVRRKGLEKYFRCETVVTSVKPVSPSNDRLDTIYGWIVEGFEKKTGKRFKYRCKRVILASGTTDFSNHLGIPGENSHPQWIVHNLNDLEARMDELVARRSDQLSERLKPVLVIGAGLSAADAIMASRFRGISVLHAFRDSSNNWSKQTSEKVNSSYDRLQWLPSSIYPEYHKVYEMMADGGNNYPLYKALPGYSLVDLGQSNGTIVSNERMVTLCSSDGHLQTFDVSLVAILIGYKPDMSYLESSGIGLGKYPEKWIDSKSNPIEVDNITYEVIRAPRPGLYALGPLVGDNFVRFILGGAFGILAHILSTISTT